MRKINSEAIKNKIIKVSKKLLKYMIPIILIIVMLSACAWWIFDDEGTWEEEEEGNPSTALGTAKLDTTNGIVMDRENVLTQALLSKGFTLEQIEAMDDKEKIKLLDMSKKLKKNVTSTSTLTEAEILWCANEVYSRYLEEPEQLQNLLQAELVTQYPKLGLQDKNKLDGIIQFRRVKGISDGNKINSIDLKYISPEEFDSKFAKYQEDGTEDVFKYYTLDTEGNAIVATWTQEDGTFESNNTVKSGDDRYKVSEGYDIEKIQNNYDEEYGVTDDSKDKITANYTKYIAFKKKIPYKEMVEKYTLPFEYLWELLVHTNTKNTNSYPFVKRLAQLAYDSQIIIGIYDSTTTTTTTNIKTYTENFREKTQTLQANETDYSVIDNPDFGSPQSYTYEEKSVVVTKTNNIQLDILYADVWIVEVQPNYQAVTQDEIPFSNTTEVGNQSIDENSWEEFQVIDGQYYAHPIRWNEITGEVIATVNRKERKIVQKQITGETYDSLIDETTTSFQKVSENSVHEKTDINPESPDNFVKALRDNETAYEVMIKRSTIPWLTGMISQNQSTVNMVDITLYLIEKAKNPDTEYTKIDFDFSYYEGNPLTFTTISSGNALWEYIKAWEGHFGISEDGTKYKIGVDSEGHPTVGYGVNLDAHGERFTAAGYSTKENDYVDINFVDSISLEIVNRNRESVISQTQNCQPPLNNQQIDALTAVMYQYGAIGNFVSMYNTYGDTEELRDYVFKGNGKWKYYFKQNPSDGRAESIWKLFHEGIYTDKKGNAIVAAGTEAIVTEGDTTIKQYTSAVGGKTYKEYKQDCGPWTQQPYAGSTIAKVGCSITAVSIVSGAYGRDNNPSYYSTTGMQSIIGIVQAFAGNSVKVEGAQNARADILNHLNTGNAVIVKVKPGRKGVSKYTDNQHFMALLDVSGDTVYVSNPNSKKPTGWDSIDNVLISLDYYIKVKP